MAAIMPYGQVLLESNLRRSVTQAKARGRHTRSSVLETLAEQRDEVRRFGVRSLGLFGSAARGEATATSDLDFLVEFERRALIRTWACSSIWRNCSAVRWTV